MKQLKVIEIWDQQENESNDDFKSFKYYLKAGKNRDILSAYNHNKPIDQRENFTPTDFMTMTENNNWWERVKEYEINKRQKEEDIFDNEKRQMQTARRNLNKDLHSIAQKIAKQFLTNSDKDEINLNDYLKFINATTKLHNDIRIEYGEENMFSVGSHKTQINSSTITISTTAKEDLERLILDDQIAIESMPEAIQK